MTENNHSDEQAADDRDEQDPGPAGTGSDQGSLSATSYRAEDVFENAEPWDPRETKIVVASFIAALIFLAIFGYLINVFIL